MSVGCGMQPRPWCLHCGRVIRVLSSGLIPTVPVTMGYTHVQLDRPHPLMGYEPEYTLRGFLQLHPVQSRLEQGYLGTYPTHGRSLSYTYDLRLHGLTPCSYSISSWQEDPSAWHVPGPAPSSEAVVQD